MRKWFLSLLLCLLLFGCTIGTQEPSVQETPVTPPPAAMQETVEQTDTADPGEVEKPSVPETQTQPSKKTESTSKTEEIPQTETQTTSVSEEVQKEEPQSAAPSCIISISCKKLLEQIDLCDPNKVELLPSDGWILPPTQVELLAGESVFDLLLRVCREQGILMEYSDAPMYDSAYIEGIANIYEFDGGPLSGWRYSVNGSDPNYGCSNYILKENDTVCWEYTCDLGELQQ